MIRTEFSPPISARQARAKALVADEVICLGRPARTKPSSRSPDDRDVEDTSVDPPGTPGPEEDLLRAIVATAATIRHGGQVSPITVVEMDGGSYYRIETGERRYWAHHWLNMWVANGFDQIQCIVVPQASPWRQAAENTSREGLSAMALARQLATLLLDLYDIHPDYTRAIPNDWYRQALEYRVPRGEGEALRAALGSVQRSQFSRIQALLRLPDSVWELADRHRLEEKRLRPVLKVPDATLQVKLVRMIVEQNLTAERVQRLVESGELITALDDGAVRREALPQRNGIGARRQPVAGAGPPVLEADLDFVADQWVRQKPQDVRQQVAVLRRLLELVEAGEGLTRGICCPRAT